MSDNPTAPRQDLPRGDDTYDAAHADDRGTGSGGSEGSDREPASPAAVESPTPVQERGFRHAEWAVEQKKSSVDATTLHERAAEFRRSLKPPVPPSPRTTGRRLTSFIGKYWPPTASFLFLAAAFAASAVLMNGGPLGHGASVADNTLNHAKGITGSQVGSAAWQTWVGTVALALGAGAVLLVRGGVDLVRTEKELLITRREALLHTIAATGFIAGVGVLSKVNAHADREWPDGLQMEWRLPFVAISILACSVPYVALTWLVHQVTRDYWRRVTQDEREPEPTHTQQLEVLLDVWKRINQFTLAFGVFVVLALVPTGALRNVWLSQTGGGTAKQLEAAFPAGDVLLYGALFAVLSAVLVVPMVFSWRSAARKLLDAMCPLTEDNAKASDKADERARVEKLLNLDNNLIRNPLTVFSVLTPLITATLTAFLPQLSGK